MTKRYLFGFGLPTPLTSRRVERLLSLARGQIKELRGVLDDDDTAAWRRSAGADNFYGRIRRLLRTAEGRRVYAGARLVFETAKTKRKDRANVFLRSVRDCLPAPDADPDPLPLSINADSYDAFVAHSARTQPVERTAELAWSYAMLLDSPGKLLEAIRKYPEIGSFLEEPVSGLVPILGPAEGAVGALSSAIDAIDPSYLTEADVEALDAIAKRLGRTIKNGRTALERLSKRLDEWQARHGDRLSADPELTGRFSQLQQQAATRSIDDARLTEALARFDRIVAKDKELADTQTALETLSRKFEEARNARKNLFLDVDELVDKPAPGGGPAAAAAAGRRPRSGAAAGPEPDRDTVADSDAHGPAGGDDDGDDDEAESTDHEDAISERPPPEPVDGDDDEAAASPPPAAEDRSGDASASGDDDVSANGDDAASKRPLPDPGSEPVDGSAEAAGQSKPGAEDSGGDVSEPHPDPERQIDEGIMAAMERHRFGIAYHLALTESGSVLSADVIKLIASNFAADAGEFAATGIAAVAENIKSELDISDEAGGCGADHAALVAAAALAPALLAPGGPIEQLLSAVVPRLSRAPSLKSLASAAADVSRTGVSLPPESLGAGDPLEQWRKTLSDITGEAAAWLESERQVTILYQAATRVWRRMLEDWGDGGQRMSIGRMMNGLLGAGPRSDAAPIAAAAQHWRTGGDEEIDRIDRGLRGKTGIVGRARQVILHKTESAVALVDRWSAHMAARPKQRPDFIARQANALRDAVSRYAEPARGELGKLETPKARCAETVLRRYTAKFDGAGSAAPALTVSELLHSDLLAIPDISFDDDGLPVSSLVEPGVLLPFADLDRIDFAAAANERARRRDFTGARMILDLASRNSGIDGTARSGRENDSAAADA